jgi:hypothetical protein
MSYNKMNRKCYNNNTNNCLPKGTHPRKSLSTSENVKLSFFLLMLEGIEIEGQEEEEE